MATTTRILLILCAAVSAFALAVAAARPWSMLFWSTARYSGLLAALAAATVVALLAARRPPAPRPGALIVGVACFGVAAAIPWFAWFQPFKALWWTMYAGCSAGVFATLVWLGPRIARRTPARLARRVATVTVQLAIVVIALELGLRALSVMTGLPVLETGADSNAVFARYRKAPGAPHLGVACDERGFADHLRRAEGSKLVVCVGDSFGIGVVPPPFHYTTVAEEQLDGVEVYNAGVIAAGPAEYLALLRDELLPLQPDAVLVALFVGNDVEEATRFAADRPLLRALFDRSHLRLYTVPKRLTAILRERGAGGASESAIGTIQGEGADLLAPDAPTAAFVDRFPWLGDPALEEPMMSPETFELVERRRAEFACDPAEPGRYDPLFDALEAIRKTCGGVPLACVLIPDEFQVEDALWARIASPRLERDLPQHRIGAWLAERGIACLDLLPVLRAVPADGDGRRHLYHLRDTHWNQRGNARAGEALAAFLARWPGDG